MYVMGSRWLA